ncbi:putative small secreted protein [Enterococcus sp. PF1-24]|uniref:PepSY domain-containing protein n=1 Tax=unclassified Enterococcus TaxID=2608891 RepID=UPI002473EEC8|nr:MULTISPECIES: PepSY domain-containing protein [unclassified Enterococcus]MDH6364247.1 putative small secreted protein [Enterococcus sp. PFB1-1]MDH6401394.1 putative small secreted protein [Enterococcus sp. PF1-24]
MNEDNQVSWFKSGLTLGLGFGLVGGAASALWYRKHKTLSADNVLKNIKEAFLAEGPVEGSWISFEKQPLRKFAIRSKSYSGGITRIEDGELITYEFLADAYTGTVLDIKRS